MSKSENNKPSIFQKVLELGNTYIDSQIFKAKTTILNSNIEDDFYYGKAVLEDPSYSQHAQGYKDKPYRIQNGHLKQMSYNSTPVAGVIQTRQNQAAAHSKLVKSVQEKGFMICLKDEDALLAKIKEDLKLEMDSAQEDSTTQEPENPEVAKAEADDTGDDTSLEGTQDENPEDNGKSDDEVEEYNWELDRKAREKLNKQFESAKKKVEDYILSCGLPDNRPFETKKWNFDSAIRAWVRDTYTYDLYSTEIVPDRAGRPHHWFPMDGGTIKQASLDLKKYKDLAQNFYNLDILYPERAEEAKEKQKVIELKPELLEKGLYRWVQVIRGKIERAYTDDELKVGIRNVNTDIFNNGYGISELELLVGMITGHLNAEFYNQAYFTQGFSAKGILHIKAAINRRKLETVRTQWQHMLKGSRNSFQTPIFAGVEDVKWVPLTQNHNDIGFEGWMRYLVTMICSIFQIDPSEIGIHFKAEGSGGGLSDKSDTKEKISHSKDKGLYPLLRHFENYINESIIKPFDARFVIKFTGLAEESKDEVVERQSKEVKFKKTINEVRGEDGLPPIPGGDEIILDPTYMQWYLQFSKKAVKKQKDDQKNQEKLMQQQNPGNPDDQEPKTPPEEDIYGEGALHMTDNQDNFAKSKKHKQVKVEIYNIRKE